MWIDKFSCMSTRDSGLTSKVTAADLFSFEYFKFITSEVISLQSVSEQSARGFAESFKALAWVQSEGPELCKPHFTNVWARYLSLACQWTPQGCENSILYKNAFAIAQNLWNQLFMTSQRALLLSYLATTPLVKTNLVNVLLSSCFPNMQGEVSVLAESSILSILQKAVNTGLIIAVFYF